MALCNSLVGGINSFKWASWNVSPHLQTSTRPLAASGKYVVRYETPTTDSIYSNLTTTMSSDLNNEFMHVYDTLKFELVHDQAFVSDDNSRQWVERMIDYNVPGGKMVRAFSVVDSCQLMKGEKMTEDEVFLACALGWCTEWLQASFVVLDDIMDASHTRRGRSCWYRLPEVGMTAVNDGLMLRNHVHRILKKHFHDKAYYMQLVDLFNEAEFQTVCGEMIDIIATLDGKKDLSKYTMSLNRRIFEYKSSYYSFYLPIACALLLFGDNLDDHVLAKDVLIEMGIYYQVQNDYLDTYGDPNVFGKTGTDIEECKCSWLIVKALELANDEQKKILSENYGSTDPEKVAKVKELYQTLKLKGVYEEYESNIYAELIKSIEAHPSKPVQGVLKSCLGKIYKGHN